MEIIYRVYEILDGCTDYSYNGNKIMLEQDVCCCDSREHFKEIMKDMYAPKDIKFANSSKLKDGDIFVKIISEDCYNAHRYMSFNEYVCDHCNIKFKLSNYSSPKGYSAYEFNVNGVLDKVLELNRNRIDDLNFCSCKCKSEHYNLILDDLKKQSEKYLKEHDDYIPKDFITRESFDMNCGYIYMISKKSTGEFYVGQTKYIPIFRWGQHLKTDRFKINNIEDYRFEVLEVVKDRNILSEREAYWINEKKSKNPKLSLNVVIPKEHLEIEFVEE